MKAKMFFLGIICLKPNPTMIFKQTTKSVYFSEPFQFIVI